MTRNQTFVNSLISTLNSIRTSSFFTQTLYDSESFNAKKDTSEVLRGFFNKNSFVSHDVGISNSMFRKEKLNKRPNIGKDTAKVFSGKRLKLDDG